ncbi:hypothetical protein, conserved [Leishmania tarentolae]|uniref:Uncharacterized protein n=1 Tax=Leishmania tarentolae TaxID=5689 RepID=A0A640KEY1_LEITA|nr:hypothetical protein, conserved [Leishmania tarentolae]
MLRAACLRRESRQGCRCCRTSAVVAPLLVLAFLLFTLSVLPSPATAAMGSSHSAATHGGSVVPHIGDFVPLTVYLRTERQIRRSFISVADQQLAVDEEAVVDNAEGNVEADTAAEFLKPKDLDLPSLGATRGKHEKQLVYLLSPASSPRFGINKAATLMANFTLRAAGQSLQEDTTLQQSDWALRFSVGRGLHKESTWLPVAARQKYTSRLSETLAGRLHELQAADAAAERHRDEEAGEAVDNAAAAQKVQYLSRITFFFGYHKGDLPKMTSFSIAALYSPEMKPGIELQFLWIESRPYNPNRAVTLCSAVAVLVSMITVLAVFHPSSRSMLLFSQRIVAVRAHD